LTTILFFLFSSDTFSLSVGTKRIPLHYSLYFSFLTILVGCNETENTDDGRTDQIRCGSGTCLFNTTMHQIGPGILFAVRKLTPSVLGSYAGGLLERQSRLEKEFTSYSYVHLLAYISRKGGKAFATCEASLGWKRLTFVDGRPITFLFFFHISILQHRLLILSGTWRHDLHRVQ
jgi:hypothetical protein